MKCENCGAEVTEGRFCPYCGSELPKEGVINIKGNNNTVTTVNHYYSPPTEERKEYVPPKLKRFVPKDDSFLKKEVIYYFIIEGLLIAIFIVLSLIQGSLFIMPLLAAIGLGIYFYKTHQAHKQEFYDSEYEREEKINRINYKREYDAWFDSLSESEKQTELMRRMVEKNR